MSEQLDPVRFQNPAVLLSGAVDYEMYACFRSGIAAAPQEGVVVVELSTLGGDPEVARMMGRMFASTLNWSRSVGSCFSARPRSIPLARRS